MSNQTQSAAALQAELTSFEALENFAPLVLLRTMQRMGVAQTAGERYTFAGLKTQLGVIPKYERLYAALLAIMQQAGYLTTDLTTTSAITEVQPTLDILPQQNESLKQTHPKLEPHFHFQWTCVEALPDIIQGKVLATDVMFPGGSMVLVEPIYRGSQLSDYFSRMAALGVKSYVEQRVATLQPGETIRIVEVGAGTGSATGFVLPAIAPYAEHLSYVYTDVSPSFTYHGQQRFAATYPFVTFQLFDLEKPAAAQGFQPGSAEVVLGANVVHTTLDIHRTLQNLKTLLRTNGVLILNEATDFSVFSTLTFGLLEGWGTFTDEARRIPHSPLLSQLQWQVTLAENGFTSVTCFTLPEQFATYDAVQCVLVGQSDGLLPGATATNSAMQSQPVALPEPPTPPLTPPPAPAPTPPSEPQGDPTADIEQLIVREVAALLKLSPTRIERDESFAHYGVDSIVGIEFVNRISAQVGLQLRTTALFDYPDIQTLAQHIATEGGTVILQDAPPPPLPEPIVAPPPKPVLPSPEPIAPLTLAAPGTPQAVVIRQPGTPATLQVESITVPPPAADEIQVSVRAFSLNFADLLCLRGMYPTMPPYPFTPGFEVAGVVAQVGHAVTDFKPGDAVVALTTGQLGGHATRVNARADLSIHKPANLTFEEACAFPIVFLTAYVAFEKASVTHGEKVLIQTAAGGVGLMAVQLAQQRGAEIFGTAGSDEKCDYLRRMGVEHVINYRQQDFAAAIRDITGGYGVDVVLNTLPVEYIQKGLDSLAPGGRYIEIAMAGLKSATAINLTNLVNNQSLHTIDLGRMTRQPDEIRTHLEQMRQIMLTGNISPTVDNVFSFAEVAQAYQHLSDRRNIGKVVVRTAEVAAPIIPPIEPAAPVRPSQDVAIIGMAGRFGGAASVAEFWTHLAAGDSLITEVPPERWSLAEHYDPDPQAPNKTYARHGSFVPDIDRFDAKFFKLSGREAESMDPQQRLFLETCWTTLEDAGYAASTLAGQNCGVFLGGGGGDYQLNIMRAGLPVVGHAFMGNDPSICAARISYHLNLKGPTLSVNTACSSSLVAIHLACQSIIHGESDMALAGGVFITTTPDFHILSSKVGMLSPEGKCKTFADGADGFVPGEGVGAILLKPLERALADGDHIYGIIRAIGMNQDGRTNGITAPSGVSQTTLETMVYERGDINPETITYAECHGTGTKLGDPIEIEALTNAFRQYTDRKQFCAVGSVKTNIGHAAMAAGISSVIKVLLSLQHKQIPPSLNFDTPNHHIDFDNSPFYVNTRLRDWNPDDVPRRAAISSFGFSGTNVHMVIEEPPPPVTRPEDGLPQVVVLSAKTEDRLRPYARNLHSFLSKHRPPLADVAYTLQTGRDAMAERVAFVVSSLDDLQTQLAAYLNGSSLPTGTDPRLTDLAQRWVAGERIDWTTLHFTPRRRIPLPTYPFARERYWLPPREGGAIAPSPAVESPVDIFYAAPQWHETPIPPAQPVADMLVMVGIPGAAERIHQMYPAVDVVALPALADEAARVIAWVQHAREHLAAQLSDSPGAAVRVRILVAADDIAGAALVGLLKTARLEHPALDARVIFNAASDVGALVSQEAHPDTAVAVRYNATGRREVRRLVEMPAPTSNGDPWLRPGGIYWLTGGLGGLGRVMAQHLAESAVTLILSGRSPLDAGGEQFLAELRVLGATVDYVRADVSRYDEVIAAMNYIKTQHGPLNGLIHTAGVIRDRLLLQKTDNDIAAVLAPKVAGILNLDAATQTEPLDFVLLFSSLAGELSSLGQADYAAANAYLDAFAAQRQQRVEAGQRQGRTVSINWPLWSKGGMQLDADNATRLKQQFGVEPLPTAAGLRIIAAMLTASPVVTQILVAAGDIAKLQTAILPPEPATPTPGKSVSIDSNKLRDALGSDLHRLAAEVLKLELADIPMQAELGEYGFDSITMTDFVHMLNDTFRLALTPPLLFEHNTLARLRDHLAEAQQATLAAHYDLIAAPSGKPQPQAVPTPASVVAQPPPPSDRDNDAIAIVGISGIMPQSPDLEAFWAHLAAGESMISEVPAERWDWRDFYGDPEQDPNKSYVKWGGFVPDVDKFDPLFFKVSPHEAEMMDPQHRLFLQCVWHCIEDAGYRPGELAGRSVGVYAGIQFQEYRELITQAQGQFNPHVATGNGHAMLANRVSFLLDLRGPSEAIDTACSASLVALHRAVRSIRSGEVESAIVGGVSLALSPWTFVATAQMGILSPDGTGRTFDKHANGYVKGEGVGAMLLKPLAQAQADGDPIYALVRGTAENHGGRATSLTAPNPTAQAEVIKKAIAAANIDPTTITYIETHGTGTVLGDPVEIDGLKQAFPRVETAYCGLGSVKPSIGHLEPAAGIAGVFKILLAMQHHTLPATINFTEQNPYINLTDSPFYLVTETRPWHAPTGVPRRAGISAFGFGGANAHAILEEAPSRIKTRPQCPPYVVVLSAKTPECLRESVRRLREFVAAHGHGPADGSGLQADLIKQVATLAGVSPNDINTDQPLTEYGFDPVQLSRLKDTLETAYRCEVPFALLATQPTIATLTAHLAPMTGQPAPQLDLAALTYTLQVGREAMGVRLAFVVADAAELEGKLSAFCDDTPGSDLYYNEIQPDSQRLSILTRNVEFVEALVQQGKLADLAQLWVEGVEIDWQRIYSTERPPRMHLPPYPFAKERYWIPAPLTPQRESTAPSREVPPDTLLVEEVWHPVPLPADNIDWATLLGQQQGRRLLVLCDNDADHATLNGLLGNISQLVATPPAYEVAQLGDIGPLGPWIETLVRDNRLPDAVLIASRAADESLAQVRLCFEAIQSLMKHAWNTPIHGCYLFTGEQPTLQALSGLTNSASLENPQHSYKVIQVDASLTEPQRAIILLNEWLLAPSEPTAVRYNSLARHVRVLQSLANPTEAPAPAFRVGGAYLITGGLGQIGQALCEYLAEMYQATLVILGRSPLTADKQQQLQRLERKGGTASYHAVDITVASALTATLAQVKTTVPVLHGVIHLARLVEDGLIVNKSFADFERVGAAKVAGTRNLDAATRAEPLDFFLMFSSMAAYGLKGSPDYAYATAYQNAFATQRQGPGQTLALCWGQWDMDPYSDATRNQKLADLGFDFLTLETALPLMAHALHQPTPVLGALAVSDVAQVKTMLGITAPATPATPIAQLVSDVKAGRLTRDDVLQTMATLDLNQVSDADINVLHTFLMPAAPNGQGAPSVPSDIKAIILSSLAQILKMDAQAIPVTEPLQNYGLDSITGTQLAVALEKSLGLEVRPRWLVEYPTVEALSHKLEAMRSHV